MPAVLVRALGAPLVLALLLLAFAGTALAAPANDNFAAAEVLSGTPVSAEGSTLAATAETGEPAHGGSGHSVWYRWTPTRSGLIRFSCQGSFAVVAAVYRAPATASLGELEEVFSDRSGHYCEFGGGRFRAVAGASYWLLVDAVGSGGEFRLEVENTSTAPANDDFAAAEAAKSYGPLFGTTEGAGRELGEPFHGGAALGSSVWFRWTAPETHTYLLYPCQSGFHPYVEVFAGARLDALTPVGSWGGFPSLPYTPGCSLGGLTGITFPALAGQTYSIAVDGLAGEWGNFELRLGLLPGPPIGPHAQIKPKMKINGSRATIEFFTTEAATGFVCQLDRRKAVPCVSPLTYPHLRLGRHRFAVSAIGAPEDIVAGPAVRHFQILAKGGRR